MPRKKCDHNEQLSLKLLSIEELEELISEASLLDDADTDYDFLFAVLDEYGTREGVPQISPERAQELYRERVEPLIEQEKKVTRKPQSGRQHTLRVAVIAAVISVMLIGSALAAGTDFFNVVFSWGKEYLTLNISSEDAATPSDAREKHIEVPDELKPIQEALEERGITASLLPTYFPEGYEALNTEIYDDEFGSSIYYTFQKGNEVIAISFSWYDTGEIEESYEKDTKSPVAYEVNGTTYYIITNMGMYYAVWTCDNIVCDIDVGYNAEELYKMLDSIP